MTQYTNTELANIIIDSCKSHTELNDFIDATFGKPLTYSNGLDANVDYYSEDEYRLTPIMIIDSIRKEDHTSREVSVLYLHIKIAHKDEFKTGFTVVNDVIQLSGIQEVENICVLTKEAISNSPSLHDYELDIDYELAPLLGMANWSEYNGIIKCSFVEDRTIGC